MSLHTLKDSVKDNLKFIFSILFSFGFIISFAQDSTSFLKKHFEAHGYVKYMHTMSFTDLNYISADQLIHNRINTKTYLSNDLTLKVDFRNRIFYGDQVRLFPQNYKQLEQDNGWVDMSLLWLDESAIYGHTTIDRAYLDYNKGNLNIKLGRQRINWGINLAWNPNDLFNAYNFANFDYQERPGADALRVQYYTNGMNSIEFAGKMADSIPDMTFAGKYAFNTKGYDVQIIGGKYLTDATLGVGWAGNIKDAGFKGEATYFHPYENLSDTIGDVSASVSFDYLIKGGWYINVGGLYNSTGTNDKFNPLAPTIFTNITAKNLMPSKWSGMTQVSYQLSPLTSISLAGIYLVGMNAVFAMPSVGYSISENWNIDAIGQVYFVELNNKFQGAGNSVFLRLIYSF